MKLVGQISMLKPYYIFDNMRRRLVAKLQYPHNQLLILKKCVLTINSGSPGEQ